MSGTIPKANPVNSIEAPAYMPSMSTRASITRAQVRKVAEEDVLAMATQLKQWGAKLDELAAKVVAAGANARIGYREGIDELKAKYEVARARFSEFKSAGSAKWRLFKSSIERAWNDFETAFEKLANQIARGSLAKGDNP
jgi:hypothetical protein